MLLRNRLRKWPSSVAAALDGRSLGFGEPGRDPIGDTVRDPIADTGTDLSQRLDSLCQPGAKFCNFCKI